MRFNLLVENHLGATRTRAVCEPCAIRFPGRLLREPGTGEWSAPTERYPRGLPLAGPVVVRESEHGECSQCGASDARIGYLRCCSRCSRTLLLDYCEKDYPPAPVLCPKCTSKETAR